MRSYECRPRFGFFKFAVLAMLVLLSLCSCFSKGKNVDPADRFIKELSRKDPAVRWNAATALGAMKDARAVDALIAALRDDDFTVRSAAAVALGKIRDARAVESLSVALKDENFSVRKDAADVPCLHRQPRRRDADQFPEGQGRIRPKRSRGRAGKNLFPLRRTTDRNPE